MEAEIKEELIAGEETMTGEGEDIADTGIEIAGKPKKDELIEDKEVIKEAEKKEE